MDVEAKSFKYALFWEEKKIIKDNYFLQNKILKELFEPKIKFPDLQNIGFLIKYVFLPREHMRGQSWESYFCPSVCPSVCLSVTCVHCNKTKWHTADILYHM